MTVQSSRRLISFDGGARVAGLAAAYEGLAENSKSGRKDSGMGRAFKNFFVLDFEGEFTKSFLKLLFFWNPLWIVLVTLFWERALGSFFFDFYRKFIVATVTVLLGMLVVKGYLLVERALARRSSSIPPVHSMGWYLLLLAFALSPGLVLGSYAYVAILNIQYPFGSPIRADFPWRYYRGEIFAGWALLLVCFLYMSWQDLRDAARLARLKAEELEKERLQALLTNLKDQMNPHFLFNTLNTVASLIPAEPAKAERVVVRLSTLYQGVLEATRKTSQTLSKEMAFCRDYLDIEQIRFGDRLKVKVQTEKGLDAGKFWVPVLVLQPLVENAVKHGLSSRAAGGNIWVKAAKKDGALELSVEDDGIGFGRSPYAGSGTALENCRRRLELSFGKNGRLDIGLREGGGTKVVLTMPIVTNDPSLKVGK